MASQEQAKLDSWVAPGADMRAGPARVVGVLAMVALIAVCAQLAVPLPGTPVPVTLQDLAVFVAGVVLGPVQGALAVASYVLLGAMGAPVFSNGNGGLGWLMGPTGGYLLAFPVAAFVMGHATAPGRPGWLLPLGVVAAQLVIFAGGVLQLALVTGNELAAGVALGVIPFLPGVAFKSAVVVIFAVALGRWRRREAADRDPGAPGRE